MGKTTYHKLKGKLYFPFLTEPDEYMDKKFWAVKIALDDESRVEFDKSGIKCQFKPLDKDDEDSPEVVRFKREFSRNFGEGEKELGRPAMSIWNEEAGEYEPFDSPEIIGNGTLAYVNVEAYPTRMGMGHRLRDISILDLVEYVPEAKEEETAGQDAPAPELAGAGEEASPFA